MKKFSIVILVLTVVLSLAACGCQNSNNATNTTGTQADTNMTILPDMDNTLGTNIPDPDVDTSMPIYTDGTGTTDDTGMTDNTGIPGITNGRSR